MMASTIGRTGGRGGAARRGPEPGVGRSPLRIGILAPPWVAVPPPGYGGTESVVDRLARGLQTAGHEVRLWTTGDSTCPVPRGSTFVTARTEVMGTTSTELRHVVEGYEWFVAEHCEIVHDHTLAGPFVGAGAVPVIVTNHGPFDQPDSATIFRRLQWSVPLIAISHHHATDAIRVGIRATHVIHHGIDVDEVPPGTGLGDADGRYLLFLGRMNPDKGLSEAIDVARATGWRLLIAARMHEPGQREYFEREIAPRCTDGIEYIGEVGGARKQELLGAAAALLNPIQWPEPFGLVMIEALAVGTPVISTHRGAAPEIVVHGRTGFLGDDRREWELAVRSIDRIDRSICRADVARRFSTERMVVKHLAAYAAAIGAAGRRRTAVPSSLIGA
jgi:glycosyltransferase involved in cell wall biosynthesis